MLNIDRIEFSHYKAFAEKAQVDAQVLDIAPLTLVFGKNNSGKSATVRLPALLLGALECEDDRLMPLGVRGQSYGNSFLDIASGGDFFSRPNFRLIGKRGGEKIDLSVVIFAKDALSSGEPPRIWSYEMRSPDSLKAELLSSESMPSNFLPSEDRWKSWRASATEALNSMVHLGPVRASIQMAYSDANFSSLGLKGEGAPYLLRANSRLLEAVGRWYADHLDDWALKIQSDGSSFSLKVANPNKATTNLAQSGEGLQQVLPVVAHQIWRQMTGGEFLDVVEQPELHLHPGAQASLADLYIDTAKKGAGKTLVETNSKGILLRVQRRIAEKIISPEKVKVYFVSESEHGSCLREIKIDSAGELDWWPEGVFDEDFREVAAMRRAQRSLSE